MKKPVTFREYIWLLETIYKEKQLSLAEINERWLAMEMSEGISIQPRTFHRHRDAIADIFGIHIDYDLKTKKYYIINRRDMQQGTVANWLMDTLSVGNELADCVGLKDRIILENTPAAGIALESVVKAMKKNVRLKFTYKKYDETLTTTRTVEPYCLKLYSRQWYLLGKENGTLKQFGLDRIISAEISDERFEMDRDFSAERYYQETYGLVNDQKMSVARITVRAYGKEVSRIESQPIHPSQQLLHRGDGWSDFQMEMKPSYEFRGMILSRAGLLQVLQPEWLVEEIKGMALKVIGKEDETIKTIKEF